MKLPEPLFAIINPAMRLLLRSPLHAIASGSLMLVTYRGRKSGRTYTTPVRYVRGDGVIRCFTSTDTQWWRNLRHGADVVLRIQGEDGNFRTTVIERDPQQVKQLLIDYLRIFPQDAAYHDIRLNPDKTPVAADLDFAAQHAIVVEARPG